MQKVRRMTNDDLPLCMRLKEQAGWNQREEDLRRFLELEPEGCFIAQCNGTACGTVTTCCFQKVGWVGMMLVEESCRGQGLGKLLMSQALEYLKHQGVDCFRLDATPIGRPLYEKLGFLPQFKLSRYAGVARPIAPIGTSIKIEPYDPKSFDDIFDLDKRVNNTNRRRLLLRLFQENPLQVRVARQDEKICGWALHRQGALAAFIGPCLAVSAHVGRCLFADLFSHLEGKQVFIDIPHDNSEAIKTATQAGLIPVRDLLRMYQGRKITEQLECLWATSGPEKG